MKSLTPPIGVQIYTQFLNLQNFLAKFSIYPPPTTAIGLSVQALRIGGFFVSVPHLHHSDNKLKFSEISSHLRPLNHWLEWNVRQVLSIRANLFIEATANYFYRKIRVCRWVGGELRRLGRLVSLMRLRNLMSLRKLMNIGVLRSGVRPKGAQALPKLLKFPKFL